MKANEIIKKYFRLGEPVLPDSKLDFLDDDCLPKYQSALEIPSLRVLTDLLYDYNETQIKLFLNINLLKQGMKCITHSHSINTDEKLSIHIDTIFNFDNNTLYVEMSNYKHGKCVGDRYRVIEILDDNLKDLLILFLEIKSLSAIPMMEFIKRYERDLIKSEGGESVFDLETLIRQLNKSLQEYKSRGVSLKDISDGYHTFDELYYHRMILFSIICKMHKDKAWRAPLHADGTMFDDMFIVGIETPQGQYTYHYHNEYWNEFNGIKDLEFAPEWDGIQGVSIERLISLIGEELR